MSHEDNQSAIKVAKLISSPLVQRPNDAIMSIKWRIFNRLYYFFSPSKHVVIKNPFGIKNFIYFFRSFVRRKNDDDHDMSEAYQEKKRHKILLFNLSPSLNVINVNTLFSLWFISISDGYDERSLIHSSWLMIRGDDDYRRIL